MITAIHENDEDLRLLRIGQVLDLIPMSKSSLYRSIEGGSFPPPVKENGVSFWLNSEIRGWLREKCRTRRSHGDLI